MPNETPVSFRDKLAALAAVIEEIHLRRNGATETPNGDGVLDRVIKIRKEATQKILAPTPRQ